jgi:glycosyltransferase involved in cell wall biosynthesis
MIFSRRMAAALQSAGACMKLVFLESTASPVRLILQGVRVAGEVRRFRPDIVHADFGARLALVAALATRRPLVVTFRGSDLNPSPETSRPFNAIYHFASQIAALRAAAIICVSKQLRSRLWWRRDRATVIPSGVDLSMFGPMPQSQARERLGLSATEEIVAFYGNASRTGKRLDLAIAAIEHAKRAGRNARLLVMDGSADPADVPLYLNSADCLVVTSDWEGSPTIVQEAMACNLPVVSVDVGDVAEQLAGIAPSKIVPRDPASLGDAVLQVLSERRRSNGFAKAQRVSTKVLAGEIRALYMGILKQRSVSRE